MSLNFAMKDLTRRWSQSSSYIKSVMFITSIAVFFANFSNIPFYISNLDSLFYSFTIRDLFGKYFLLFIIASIIIVLIWIIFINHSYITHKVKDIAIIKVVGAIPKTASSIMYSEVLMMNIIGLLLGSALGYLLYLTFFFGISLMGYSLIIYMDFFYTPILFISSIIVVYVINGIEIRSLSGKRYNDLISGDIPQKYSAIGGLKYIPKILSKISFTIKIAVTNLVRKKQQFYRVLIVVTISFTVLLTTTTGIFYFKNMIDDQISGSQADLKLAIGYTDVLSFYQSRYAEFSNSSISTDLNENLIDPSNVMNQTQMENLIQGLINNSALNGVDYYDSRLIVNIEAKELTKVVITGDFNQYLDIGQNRSGTITVVGTQFKDFINEWKYEGNITLNDDNFAVVGDNLAHTFFDSAIYQKLGLQTNSTLVTYFPTAILYDTFAAGNSTYVPLNSLQNDLNYNDKINLIVLHVKDNANITELKQILTEQLKLIDPNLEVLDLSETFERNEHSIDILFLISWIEIGIFVIVIIQALLNFKKGNLEAQTKDYSIIRAIGGKSSLIINIIFLEQFFIVLIATLYALPISILFNGIFLVGSASRFPPFEVILTIWFLLTLIIVIILYFLSRIMYKKRVSTRNYKLKIYH